LPRLEHRKRRTRSGAGSKRVSPRAPTAAQRRTGGTPSSPGTRPSISSSSRQSSTPSAPRATASWARRTCSSVTLAVSPVRCVGTPPVKEEPGSMLSCCNRK